MAEPLHIILYPDPRLKKVSEPVESFDASLKELVGRMFELMRLQRGVGLAAPQVGVNRRVFVTNHSGELKDDRVYVNPELFDAEDEETAEEGCLSLPDVNAEIVRAKRVRIVASDVDGKRIEDEASGYVARIWQHELDHLNGVLLIDRMGAVARMRHRKVLRELEADFHNAHSRRPRH
jgi:peptide deformylase